MNEKPKADGTRESVRAVLEKIQQHEPNLHAVAELLEAPATVEAEHRDALAAQGVCLGPLHGLPIVVTDIIDVAFVPTRSGSLTRQDNPPCERDAPVVAGTSLRMTGGLRSLTSSRRVPRYRACTAGKVSMTVRPSGG